MWNIRGYWFLAFYFPRVMPNLQGVELCFLLGISKSKVTNLEIPEIYSRKYILNLRLDFVWIVSHFKINLTHDF